MRCNWAAVRSATGWAVLVGDFDGSAQAGISTACAAGLNAASVARVANVASVANVVSAAEATHIAGRTRADERGIARNGC